jgi:hypothetical protein
MQRHTLHFAPGKTNARRHGRVRCENVECSLGTVLDISASGLRVGTGVSAPAAMSQVALHVVTGDGSFDVLCRVCWIMRDGLLNHVMGLEFIDLPPQGRAVLLAAVRGSARV